MLRDSRDVYMTSGGRLLRRSEELRCYGFVDGSTVFMSERLRGGGVHKSEKQNKQKSREKFRSNDRVKSTR